MKNTSNTGQLDRRSFLQVTALAGGGVIIGMYVPALAQQGGRGGPDLSAWSLAPNTYITVHPDNTFTIIAKNPETGQGIRAALPMIIADEFDVDWSQVKIQQADLNPKYGPQVEGGSRATPVNYDPMRQIGAGGRLMMVTAAAQLWNVPASQLTTGRGVVTHAASKRTATYASLSARVAAMPAPTAEAVKAAYKDPKNFKIIGKPIKGVDNAAIVTGKPSFSIDIEPAGTLFAVFEKCPVFGGKAVSANLDEVKRLPGVKHAFIVDAAAGRGNNSLASGVAIVADSWWLANNARRTLKVTWDEGPVATQSSVGYAAQAKQLSAQASQTPAGGGRGTAAIGDAEAAFKTAAKVVEAEYDVPAPLARAARTAELHGALHHGREARNLVVQPDSERSQNPALGAGIEPEQGDDAPGAGRRRIRPSSDQRLRRRGRQDRSSRDARSGRRPGCRACPSSCSGRGKTTWPTTSIGRAASTTSRPDSTPRASSSRSATSSPARIRSFPPTSSREASWRTSPCTRRPSRRSISRPARCGRRARTACRS